VNLLSRLPSIASSTAWGSFAQYGAGAPTTPSVLPAAGGFRLLAVPGNGQASRRKGEEDTGLAACNPAVRRPGGQSVHRSVAQVARKVAGIGMFALGHLPRSARLPTDLADPAGWRGPQGVADAGMGGVDQVRRRQAPAKGTGCYSSWEVCWADWGGWRIGLGIGAGPTWHRATGAFHHRASGGLHGSPGRWANWLRTC